MKRNGFIAIAIVVTFSLARLLSLCGAAEAQAAKAQGLITGRNGDAMTIQTPDASNLVVVLTDGTDVTQIQGVFKARRKQMSMAALIPGLQVQVEGLQREEPTGSELDQVQGQRSGGRTNHPGRAATDEGADTADPGGIGRAESRSCATTAGNAGTTTANGGGPSQDRCQQSSHRGRRQALRAVRRLQHSRRGDRVLRQWQGHPRSEVQAAAACNWLKRPRRSRRTRSR